MARQRYFDSNRRKHDPLSSERGSRQVWIVGLGIVLASGMTGCSGRAAKDAGKNIVPASANSQTAHANAETDGEREEEIKQAISSYLLAPLDQRFKFVIDGARLQASIAEYYSHATEHIGSATVNRIKFVTDTEAIGESTLTGQVNARAAEDVVSTYVRRTGGKWLVDWEANTGVNPMSLKVFNATADPTPITLRVEAELSDTYNGSFARATHYSVRLWDPIVHDDIVYGYIEHESPLGKKLFSLLHDGSLHQIVLTVQQNGEPNTALIRELVSSTWFIDAPIVVRKTGNNPVASQPSGGTLAGSSDTRPISPRTWSDASGQYKIDAEFLSAADGTVALKTATGRVIVLPLEKLSKADQQFVASQVTATQPGQGWPPYFKAPLVRIENDQSANAKRNDAAANSDSHAVGRRSKGATTADESLPLPKRAIETINFVSGFCGRLHEQIGRIGAANDTTEHKAAALGKAVQEFKAEMAGKQLSFCFRIRDVVPSARGYELVLGRAQGIKKENDVALELPQMSIHIDRDEALKAARGDILLLSGSAILTAWVDSRTPTKHKNWLTILTTSVRLDHKHGGHLGNFSIDLTDHTFKIEHRAGSESASYSGAVATAPSPVEAKQKPSTQPTSPPATPKSATSPLPLATAKTIELSDRKEFAVVLGKLRKGTKVTLQYVSGKWKDWGKSPTESPDTESPERGDQCRVAIVSHPFRDQATVLAIVPANTQSQPFEWVCPADFERVVLRINSKLGDYAKHPGGVVRYRLTISAP